MRTRKAKTREPIVTATIVAGIRAMQKPGLSTALEDGTTHPNAPPDVLPGEAEAARKALAFADEWSEWKAWDNRRKAKALRARARKLVAP